MHTITSKRIGTEPGWSDQSGYYSLQLHSLLDVQNIILLYFIVTRAVLYSSYFSCHLQSHQKIPKHMRLSCEDDLDDQGAKQIPQLMQERKIETYIAQDESPNGPDMSGHKDTLLDKVKCDEHDDLDELNSIVLVTTTCGDDKMLKTMVTRFDASHRLLFALQMVTGAILLEDHLIFPRAGDDLKSRCNAAQNFVISPDLGLLIVQTLFNIADKHGTEPFAAASIHVPNGFIICLHCDIS
jgi:hypothetical protein